MITGADSNPGFRIISFISRVLCLEDNCDFFKKKSAGDTTAIVFCSNKHKSPSKILQLVTFTLEG